MPRTIIALALLAGLGTAALPAPPPPAAYARPPAYALPPALADARAAGEEAKYYRYLDLGAAADAEEREALRRMINFSANSLSRGPRVVLARPLAGGLVLRIDLRDYRWEAKAWDALAGTSTAFVAPLVRTRKVVPTVERKVQKWWPGGTHNGTYYPPGYYLETERTAGEPRLEQERVKAAGPWLDGAQYAELAALADSPFPVMPGGEFLAKAMDASKGDFYYDLLGIGAKEADFQKLFDGDPAAGERFAADRQGVVAFSKVTQKNRRLYRVPTRGTSLGGYYWLTTDAKTDVGAQNYLRVFLDRGEKNFDASEQIASLPNGLQAYGLFNNKGERQAVAPPDIAGDHSSTNNRLDVRNGVSCVRCHTTGILSFRNRYRSLRRSAEIDTIDPKRLERLDELYGSDLADEFAADQAVYGRAVKRVTGLTAEENARLFGKVFQRWDEAPVDVAVAARETGVTEAFFLRVVRGTKAADYRDGLPDPLAVLLVGDPKEGDPPEPISRQQWSELYPQVATFLANAQKKGQGGLK